MRSNPLGANPQFSFNRFCELIEKSQPKVNFWGVRLVVTEGYPSSVYLRDVSRILLKFTDVAEKLSFQERVQGLAILEKIQSFYHSTTGLQQSSCLKRIFVVFLKLFGIYGESFYPYNERWHIEDYDTPRQLANITEDTFREAFPNQPIPPGRVFFHDFRTFTIKS
jgi:hypothetical protein